MRDNPVKISNAGQPVVLYAPLDWGLGHTTRSIPVIYQLIQLGFRIIIACNATQRSLLQETFPNLEYEHLPGYQISFGKSANTTRLRIIAQVPRILVRLFREHHRARHLQKKHQAQLIISDNRYGFNYRAVPSICITHQLHIRSGMASWVDKLLLLVNRYLLGRFNTCWIPDGKAPGNLAGALSLPFRHPPCDLVYLGALSRFEPCTPRHSEPQHIAVVLSGPEPQRSLLENRILSQAAGTSQKIIVIRGMPSPSRIPEKRGNITLYDHLDSTTLKQILCHASYVISRAGYSSLMDYMVLGCKALLIPTPGQAEQEYLGSYAEAHGWCLSFPQDQFNLWHALEKAQNFTFQKPEFPQNTLRENMQQSLQQLGLIRLS